MRVALPDKKTDDVSGPSVPAGAASGKQPLVDAKLDARVTKKYRHLLEDPWVRRFFYDKCRKSVKTGKSYIKTLGRVMEAIGQTPSSFIALPQDEREGLLIDHLEALSRTGGRNGKGRSPGYVDTTDAIIKSWMAFRRVPMQSRTNRHRDPDNSRNTTTVIPPREALRRVMRNATPREKFLVACTAYSAMRPCVLSNQEEDDGLRFRDLPEVHIVDGKVVFDAIPTLVKVRWNLSKNQKAYPTFWPQETCTYFKDLTEARIRDGEAITPDSLVFPPTMNSPSGFLGEAQLHALVRRAMDRVDVADATPYTWKSYCIDGLALTERQPDGLSKEQRMFIVGHECGLHADYQLRKSELTPETKEAIRRAYEAAAAKHLEAFPLVKPEDGRIFQYRVLLKTAGYTDEEIAELDLASMTEDELVALSKAKQPIAAASATPTAAAPAPAEPTPPAPPTQAAKPRQRLVAYAELDGLLEQGWTFVRQFDDGRVLVAA